MSRSINRRRRPIPKWVGPAAIVVGGTLLSYTVVRLLVRCRRKLPEGTTPPKQVVGDGVTIPFAEGGCDPLWPVVTKDERVGLVSYEDVNGVFHGNWARRFGAPRDGRRHAGIDLFGRAGDVVRATEDGTIVGIQSFKLGTPAVLVEHDSGVVVLYGELEPGSTEDLGLEEGSRVNAGDPIGRVGCMVEDQDGCQSHMLHFETYESGVTQNQRWYAGQIPPPALRDPTEYLLRASVNV